MDVFLIFLLVLNDSLSPVTSLPKTKIRIAGGSLTSSEEFPFMVSLHRKYGGHICGATIIARLWTMTAAHCLLHDTNLTLFSADELRMVRGVDEMDCRMSYITRRKTEERDVCGVYVHHLFIFSQVPNDIALVKVDAPWGERAKLVPIPLLHVFGTALPEGFACHLVGWWSAGKCGGVKTALPSLVSGVQYPELRYLKQQEKIPTLNITQKNIIEEDSCTNMVNKNGLNIKEISICTAPKEAGNCDGDAGAPLICDHLQVGILSWGLGYVEEGKAMPLVYVRVDTYLYWMDTVVTIFESEAVMAGPHVVLLALPLLLAWFEVTL